MRKIKRVSFRVASFFLSLLLILTSFSTMSFATETRTGVITGTGINVRSGPGTSYSKIGVQLNTGHAVTILSEHADEGGGSIPWYKISFTSGGNAYTGYVRSDYVDVDEPVILTGVVTGDGVYVRNGAGTTFDKIGIQLNSGHTVTIISEHLDVNGGSLSWYKISFTYNGTDYEGYIRSDFVRVNSSETPETDADFEKKIADFPEDYKPGLRKLHAQHPNWNFVAYHTDLDWEYIQKLENRNGYSLINSGVKAQYSTAAGCYNWQTDTYIVKEGSNWYQAHPDAVAHYMDPRNFFDETGIFQFERLAFSAETQTEAAIAKMLQGTFMAGKTLVNNNGETITYARAFLDAAKSGNVSAFALISRCIQEIGSSGNKCAFGTYPGYSGCYNFFNIGAYNGAAAGMAYAKSQGWNTPYKAIMAGGSFIGGSYIAKGQDTPYFQKFNVVNKKNPATNQYMTNIRAPYQEGSIQKKKYVSSGMLDSAFTFTIPVYWNMPAAACILPTSSTGSSNNYLSFLNVEYYTMTPTFDFNDTMNNGRTSYSVVVPKGIFSLYVTAEAASGSATITGDGEYFLNDQNTAITITCTAANGAKRNYTIYVTFEDAPPGQLPEEMPTTGTTGDCFWSLDGTKLMITGNGEMGNYVSAMENESGAAPWGSLITEVVIGSGVTSIGTYAFENCTLLTSAVIPASVETIGAHAFLDCTGLKTIHYEGTLSDRTHISLGQSNTQLTEATWHYDSCMENSDCYTHVYNNACDATCNACEAVREDLTHTYSNACDETCNVCGSSRTVDGHVYDTPCDPDCNVCGATRTAAHSYTNSCDADCNLCGELRDAAHSYSNDCDADCDVCGAAREVSGHVYDNDCDPACNVCGATRQVSDHVYDHLCDTDCNVCGATRQVAGHAYDNDCDASCNRCGALRTPPHSYDDAEDLICNGCGQDRPRYTPGDLDGVAGVDMDDAIYLLFYTFYDDDYPLNQPCDFDHNGDTDMDDAIYLLFHTFYAEDYPLT